MDEGHPKLRANQLAQTFQEALERLTALDAEWREYFASRAKASVDPQKLYFPSISLVE
jgi:hypothetical protein